MTQTLRHFSHGIVAAALVQFLCAASAHAFTILGSDVPAGVSNAVVGDVVFQSSPRVFAHKAGLGFTGLGVKGGSVGGEIDLKNEWITITFAAPVVLQEIVLGHLFQSGNRGDTVSEVARVQVLDHADLFLAGDLSVITGTSATWSAPGGGAATNLSPGLNGHGGLWSIADPFGALAVTKIKLHAVQVGRGTGASNSDFSFVSVSGAPQGQPVPEPGTALLVGAGVAGFAAAGRRRQSV